MGSIHFSQNLDKIGFDYNHFQMNAVLLIFYLFSMFFEAPLRRTRPKVCQRLEHGEKVNKKKVNLWQTFGRVIRSEASKNMEKRYLWLWDLRSN
jgi:hypothetical protein